jgi:carbohydrate kinase (thermoresistant glucokinase family)
MIIIVMGVSGCGKSTIGKLLSERLSLPFIEADDFHSKENVSKMSQGIPLTDEDRLPWLQSLSKELQSHLKEGAILACSALKESYRKILQQDLHGEITWIHLDGTKDIITQRMKNRQWHFMPEALLHSQMATLELPPYAHSFKIESDPETIVNDIAHLVGKSSQ